MKGVFYCYSAPLRDELASIGERYITKTVNPKTKKTCWIYLYNDNVTKYLDNRPKSSFKKNNSPA